MDQSGSKTEGVKGVGKSKMKGKKVEDKRGDCGVCDKEVKSHNQGLTCDMCDVWYHDMCCNISQALYLCLIQECKDGKKSGIHWYCADYNRVAKKILTKLGGLQEKQEKLEGELLEVRKEIKSMNKAVKGIQKIVDNLRKTTDKAYAEVLKEVQQEVKSIKGDLQIAKNRSYATCLKMNVGLDMKEGKAQAIQQKKKNAGASVRSS